MKELDDRGWKRFLKAIGEGKVVPVIGKELFTCGSMAFSESINYLLCREYYLDYYDGIRIDEIVDKLSIEFGNGRSEACNFIWQSMRKNSPMVSSSLARFLSIGRFPLILTTSYCPAIESILPKSEWDFCVYDKRGRLTDSADIPSSDSIKRTLYYLFGRLAQNGKYVLTEDDLLSYLHYWHNDDTRPTNLCNYLSNKMLLVLGCDYPDWLFRFMWYSMNNNFEDSLRMNQLVVTNTKVSQDYELQRFLSRIKATYSNDINAFLDDFNERWTLYAEENDLPTIGEAAEDNLDFFISYAREDARIAYEIADKLKSLGAKIWIDKIELHPGDDFPQEIKHGILECKRFIPIISRNVLKPGSRVYRKEWSEAIEESKGRLGQQYITPIRIDEVNLEHQLIPYQFIQNSHVIDYSNENFLTEFKEILRSLRRAEK